MTTHSAADHFKIPATVASRGSNHWIGSCTIGTDDGRSGGKAVVDLDTKVYGTDNLVSRCIYANSRNGAVDMF
jgi:hypothetical protein